MLIKCPECGTEVSNKAPHCVRCGAPIAEPPFSSVTAMAVHAPAKVQTVEQTSKTYNAQQLGAGLTALLGMFVVIAGQPVLGAIMGAAGFVWFVVTSVAIWWHHG